MDKVNAMRAAVDEVQRMGKTQQLQGTGDSAKALADMEANVKAVPGAMAIFSKHGFSATTWW